MKRLFKALQNKYVILHKQSLDAKGKSLRNQISNVKKLRDDKSVFRVRAYKWHFCPTDVAVNTCLWDK